MDVIDPTGQVFNDDFHVPLSELTEIDIQVWDKFREWSIEATPEQTAEALRQIYRHGDFEKFEY